MIYLPSCLSSQSSHTPSITIDDWVEYTVLDANNETNAFYGAWPPGYFFGNWSISKGEIIRYTVTTSNVLGINGSLSLGNYTFSDVRNIDAASALLLSIYPWNGGFFANTSDWILVKNLIENTNTSIEERSNFAHVINNQNKFLKVIEFNTTNYYGQSSLFYYDKFSGVLLYAKSCFLDYFLNITLMSTSLELGSLTTTLTWNHTYIFSIGFVFFVVLVIRRRL